MRTSAASAGELVYVGLGSNLGDREANLAAAVAALRALNGVLVLRRSRLYDSLAVGLPQPRFLNAVVELRTALSPRRLLGLLQTAEQTLGRTAKGLGRPRTVDLDVLLWGERILTEPDFQVPHAEMHRRRFVLEPLAELAPNIRHPVLGVSVRELLAALPSADVVPLPEAAASAGKP
ncbi:MAG: 2-amino-4-hydroxy-6-hydroxymethyldihydropteridine diphosphokinase [Myxococcaceae bacterium]